jgi:hypothetical protein
MKNILIIYPHWPPSNLAGIHRARLISNFLPDFGWHPIVLTVKAEYYEEKPDYDIIKTVASTTEVIYVDAKPIRKPRIIGDIGLRAFNFLKKEALNIIRKRKIDFVWIPIPSFYVAVLGRIIYEKTSTPYGIDYIDPWLRDISNRKNFRSILSLQLAKILEPIAVKKTSIISGVATSYYQSVLDRYFKNKKIMHVGMPYGFDPNDHKIKIDNLELPWNEDCIPYVYAGAFLPNSGLFIDKLFKYIANLIKKNQFPDKIKLFFLGTGNYTHKSIKEYAEDYNLQNIVVENRKRYPFLHILNFLSKAKGVLLIGSTEKHYTASKIFQSLLSGRPVFAILHKESSATKIFEESNADLFLVKYNEDVQKLETDISKKFYDFIVNGEKYYNPNLKALDKYSAKYSAKKLVETIEKVL